MNIINDADDWGNPNLPPGEQIRMPSNSMLPPPPPEDEPRIPFNSGGTGGVDYMVPPRVADRRFY